MYQQSNCTVHTWYTDIVYNASCLQYRKKQQTHQGTTSVWRTLGDNGLPDLLMASEVGSAKGASRFDIRLEQYPRA